MDQQVEQLHVEIMLLLLANKDVHLHHHQLQHVIAQLKLLQNVEMDQPVEQLDVEIMLLQIVK
jgi:hypothetical protein